MVENWSLSCKETHPCCSRRRQNQPLPTRVLDVGTTGSSHEPFLFETNTEQGIYTTLSHRWGNMSQQFRTTKATFNQYRIRIPLPAFPKLFHDAILVTRQLGIRYLWIDCLCIVQDDDDDWQRECEKMARIYENSFLTLSALLPTSKGSGLFQSRWQRVEPVTFRMLDGTVIGLRPSMPTLTNAVGRSVLNTRGWILQERILSPAVLHFGDSQLYWECVGGQSEEIYPVLQNHASGLMKNMLEEAQRPGSQLYPRGHYIAWYNMVMEYTRKQLTVETDRLTAILGLSERFGRVFGGTFVAGLWAQDLHRGLLWRDLTKDGFAGCKRHVARGDRKHIIAPSWSWVQNGAQVDFEWDLSFEFPSRIHAVTRLPSSTDTEIIGTRTWKCRNGHRGSVKGYIQMWCVVKRVRWVSRTVERDGKSHDDKDIKVTKSLDVLQRTIGDTELELPCLMDLDFQEPRDCYCAIIADWTFEDSWKEFFKRETESLDLRCYLVLERTRKAPRNGNPQDLGKLKRIGVGAANIPSVEQFFGNRRKHFLTIV
ncbi:heterokaryon incompatibility protein-domain-containing protein [Hyaloscypha sp. PMI_1271]|nr:heterokaryon incompatibility protein-domain-containing protein [Hyaloscypha sp. PMI_1271]